MTTCHYVYLQSAMISLEYIYFWQKNYLIFLSLFWNLDNPYYLSIGRKNVCWPGTPNIWVFWFKSDCPLKILSRNPDKSYSVDFDNNFLAFKFTMYWEDSLREIGTRGSKTELITCIICWSPLKKKVKKDIIWRHLILWYHIDSWKVRGSCVISGMNIWKSYIGALYFLRNFSKKNLMKIGSFDLAIDCVVHCAW